MTTPTAIRLDNLSKTFGRGKKQIHAVRNLSLSVATGQVYGFLGPNGAGKTTTIRMLLDLIRPTAGIAQIYDQDVRVNHAILSRVGAIVEGAAFYPFLTGRANLEVLARTGNTYNPDRITALLDQVGLAERAGQRVSGYSTGMKQRLGLAAALLSDPDLLILDEPTNGLDPAGIQEIRLFIRDLADNHGKTVFLSSHILSEIEQVCDRVAIINQGHLVKEGAVADLLADRMELRVEAEPLQQAADVLRDRWTIKPNGQWMTIQAGRDDVPVIVSQLVAAGINIYQITSQRQTLEDYFLTVTQTTEDSSHHA
jgi:ABC-2 type transport system ATP-binding protein